MGRVHRYCGQAQGARRRRCGDIVDDEQRRDCPQYLCAQRVPAAQGHLLRWRSSTICPYRLRRAALHLPLRRSERGPLYFYHGLLGCHFSNKEILLKTIVPFSFALIILAAALPLASAQTQGSSPGSPAPAGITVSGIIECGEGYTSTNSIDMKITLLDVIRGEDAWKRIRQASASNKPVESGTEYLLARIKFEYNARGTPGTCIHQLSPKEFAAYSAKGEDYAAVSIVPPRPELRKDLKSGEEAEGWLVFAVPKDDKAPLMLYSADDSGGAVEHGGGKWFLLATH